MAHFHAQEFNASLFEALKFIVKPVLPLTFAQEALESILSQKCSNLSEQPSPRCPHASLFCM